MNKKIAELNRVDINNLKNECSLDKWYIDIINKTIQELNIADISRMIRQEVYHDIAIPLAWNMLIENPYEGEMYDGQLLELLILYYEKHPRDKNERLFIAFKEKNDCDFNNHEWGILDDKIFYESLIKKLNGIFSDT